MLVFCNYISYFRYVVKILTQLVLEVEIFNNILHDPFIHLVKISPLFFPFKLNSSNLHVYNVYISSVFIFLQY
jgi:hypothetical protein